MTLRGLESGLQVQQIATAKPRTCTTDDPVDAVLDNAELSDFDYIPVARDEVIVGVIERAAARGAGPEDERRKPLSSTMLVSGHMPLGAFVPMMVQRPYWLVVQDSGVTGIVTRSDLLKLPVRLYAFALMIHVETALSALIHLLYPEGYTGWIAELSKKSQSDLEIRFARLSETRANPDWLELTYLKDKIDILTDEKAIRNRDARDGPPPAWEPPDGLRDLLCRINQVRNNVAHPKNYATSDAEMLEFLEMLDQTHRWIGRLQADVDRLTRTPRSPSQP